MKKLLHLYNYGHNPFPKLGRGGLGYHLPQYRIKGKGAEFINDKLIDSGPSTGDFLIDAEGNTLGYMEYDEEDDFEPYPVFNDIALQYLYESTYDNKDMIKYKYNPIEDIEKAYNEEKEEEYKKIHEDIKRIEDEEEEEAYTQKADKLSQDILKESLSEIQQENQTDLKDAGFPIMNETEINQIETEIKEINKLPQNKKERWLKKKYDKNDYSFFMLPNGNIECNTLEITGKHESLIDPVMNWFKNGDYYKSLKTFREQNLELGNIVEEYMFSDEYSNISNITGDTSISLTFNNTEIMNSSYITSTFKKYASINYDPSNPNHFYNLKFSPVDILKQNSCLEIKVRNHNFFNFYEDKDDPNDSILLQVTKFKGYQREIDKNGDSYTLNYKIVYNENKQCVEIFASEPKLTSKLNKEIYKNKESYEKNMIDHKYFAWFKLTKNNIKDYNTILFYDDGVYYFDMINGSDRIPSTFSYKGDKYSELVPKNMKSKNKGEYNIRKIDKKTKRLNESISRIKDGDVNEFLYNANEYIKKKNEIKKILGKEII